MYFGETKTVTPTEPSTEGARRRRMEIHPFLFIASDVALGPTRENGRKRQKLEKTVSVKTFMTLNKRDPTWKGLFPCHCRFPAEVKMRWVKRRQQRTKKPKRICRNLLQCRRILNAKGDPIVQSSAWHLSVEGEEIWKIPCRSILRFFRTNMKSPATYISLVSTRPRLRSCN